MGDFKIILVFLQCGSVLILAVGRCESHLCLLFWINNKLIHHSIRVVHNCCNVACWAVCSFVHEEFYGH